MGNLNTCKHYAFDWDDNILHMPTKIKMDKKVGDEQWEPLDVEPAEFAQIRGDKVNYRIRNNDPSQAFDEFVDFGPRGSNAFLNDVKIALDNKQYGPSWEIFVNCLKEGKLFSIVTSRSHEYASIRKSIEYIINHIFTQEEKKQMYIGCCGFNLNRIMQDSDYYYELKNRSEDRFGYIPRINYNRFTEDFIIKNYLDNCRYYGVGLPFSNDFKREFRIPEGHTTTIQEAKKMALDRFIVICGNHSSKLHNDFKLGFSDDDKKTVELIKDFFKEKSNINPTTQLYVYETSDRKIKGGIKHKYIAGEHIEETELV